MNALSPAGPLVSAIIPAYNCRDFVGRAIDSVLGQDYPHLEAVVVDDGSTDGTPVVLRPYENFPNVRVLSNGNNRGRSCSRNRGARAATGGLLLFLDADDEWTRDHCSRICALYATDSPDVIYVPPVFIDQDGAGRGRQELDARRHSAWELILAGEMPYSSGLALTRQAWLALPGFDETLHEREDWRLAIACVAQRMSIRIAPHGTCRVRKHRSNHSRNLERFAADTERVARAAMEAASGLPPRQCAALEARIYAHVALVAMAARQKHKSAQYLLRAARSSWRILGTPAPFHVLLRLLEPGLLRGLFRSQHDG